MSKLATITLFCLLLGTIKADFCHDNITLNDLPNGAVAEALDLLIKGTLDDFVACPPDFTVSPDKINLWLWNQQNPVTPILLDKENPTQIDPNLQTILLIHGWICNVTEDGIPNLRRAYLERFTDANIIGVDWSAYSIALYSESFCAVPLVGEIVGDFICLLNATLNVDISEVHIVGHSMGGQMAGIIGQVINSQCGQNLGRITALDPAGPLFQTLLPPRRLDETDAIRVEVIHSNQGQLGFYGPCGKVDFFPNCGYIQPGCVKITNDTSIGDLLNLPVSAIFCNHLRSSAYMVESINSKINFTSNSCAECPGLPYAGPCMADIIDTSQIPMGENCPSDPPNAKYLLSTNSQPPFAQG